MKETARGEKIGTDDQEIVLKKLNTKKNSVSDEICYTSLPIWQLHLTRLFWRVLVTAYIQQFMSNVSIAGAKTESFLGCISSRINMNKSIRNAQLHVNLHTQIKSLK